MTGLVPQHAQEMQRLGVIGLHLQDLPIDRLGLLKLTEAVMLDGDGHRLRDRDFPGGGHAMFLPCGRCG